MTIDNLLAVLGWSMVINFGVFLLWALAMMTIPDFVFRTQSIVTSISREDMDRIAYELMGKYKIALLVTHVGPYIALRIVY